MGVNDSEDIMAFGDVEGINYNINYMHIIKNKFQKNNLYRIKVKLIFYKSIIIKYLYIVWNLIYLI